MISVIITAYKEEKTVGKTIESFLNQKIDEKFEEKRTRLSFLVFVSDSAGFSALPHDEKVSSKQDSLV